MPKTSARILNDQGIENSVPATLSIASSVDVALQEHIRRVIPASGLNKDVLLIQLPQFLFEAFNREIVINRGFYAYPPTGLQVLKKIMSRQGFNVEILDLNYQLLKRVIDDPSFDYLQWLDIVDDYLANRNPSIIGATTISVSTQVTDPRFHLTWLLSHLRKKNKYILMAGGPVATNEYEFYLHGGYCDFVVTGEGEDKIRYLMENIYGLEANTPQQAGIYYYGGNQIRETLGNQCTVKLSGDLIHTYADLAIEDYCKVGSLNPFSRMAGIDKPFATFQLNRGCRASCKFCGVPEFMGPGVRAFDTHEVLKEMRYLVEERGIRHFEVLDDDFLGGKAHLKRLSMDMLHGMVELHREYETTWAAGNGLIAASVTRETLALMRDSGCVGFRVGIESGNPHMLKAMHKPTSLAALQRMGEILQEFPEIFVCGNYIIGLFGEETFGEMLDTFKFSCQVNLDQAAFSTFQFTSKATALTQQLKYDGKPAAEFIPVKNAGNRELAIDEDIVTGPAVFSIDKNSVPGKEQIKEIWFAFNLLSNYIDNKNIKPGGRPEKMVKWLQAVQVSYPDNPYMPLFCALANVLAGNPRQAEQEYRKAQRNLAKSGYWQTRFNQYYLQEIMDDMPNNPHAVYERLSKLQNRFKVLIHPDTA